MHFGKMGQEQATNGHRDRTNHKSERGGWKRSGEGMVADGEVEEQIYGSETEKGNMAEAVHATLEARVAAEPVIAPKEQTKDHAGKEAQEDPEPREDQVRVRRVHTLLSLVALLTWRRKTR